MRAVEISRSAVEAIQEHGRAAYPDECCGFLVAPAPEPPEGPRRVLSVQPAPNEYEGERRRRFEIRPDQLRAVEERLEPEGKVVVGFYHSHPDHPARPSAFDERHAWPWYTYLVLAVDARRPGELGGFELDPDHLTFAQVGVKVLPSEKW